MNALSNDDFAEQVMRLATPAEPFEPVVTYDRDGDCIEFLAKPGNFYAERLDDLVTVYCSQETDEVIGSLIKGVSKFCTDLLKRMPALRIVIQDKRVKLEHIFIARLCSFETSPEDVVTLKYRKLIEVAEESEAEAELCHS
jgi:hypothetical protein